METIYFSWSNRLQNIVLTHKRGYERIWEIIMVFIFFSMLHTRVKVHSVYAFVVTSSDLPILVTMYAFVVMSSELAIHVTTANTSWPTDRKDNLDEEDEKYAPFLLVLPCNWTTWLSTLWNGDQHGKRFSLSYSLMIQKIPIVLGLKKTTISWPRWWFFVSIHRLGWEMIKIVSRKTAENWKVM